MASMVYRHLGQATASLHHMAMCHRCLHLAMDLHLGHTAMVHLQVHLVHMAMAMLHHRKAHTSKHVRCGPLSLRHGRRPLQEKMMITGPGITKP